MMKLLCATTNAVKFDLGRTAFARHGITLEQILLDIDEIQGEDPEAIIRDKARRAFELTGQPVVVTDDSWSIPALNGFPGPYMKSLNHWFAPDDFIRLFHGLKDRRVYVNRYVAYQDEYETVTFSNDTPGRLAETARGTLGPPCTKVVELDGYNGLTISEMYGQNIDTEKRLDNHDGAAWDELAKWYIAHMGKINV